MSLESITFRPIGIFKSSQIHPYEAGRQPDDLHSEGCIELESGYNFEQALIGLETGQRIWVVFQFHLNNHWNTMVLPPRGSQTKIGVFATRSPYRPNNIGMSCVIIDRIEKLKIYVRGADILNESPILDIKPYVGYADAFPESEPPWLKNSEKFQIHFSDISKQQLAFLEALGLSQLRGFLHHQLEFEPTNSKKKRVSHKNESETKYVLAYRTWRIHFSLDLASKNVLIESFSSGYSSDELNPHQSNYQDTYLDKDTHRAFIKQWNCL